MLRLFKKCISLMMKKFREGKEKMHSKYFWENILQKFSWNDFTELEDGSEIVIVCQEVFEVSELSSLWNSK